MSRINFVDDILPVIGMDSFCALIKELGGTTVVIPSKRAGMYYDLLAGAVGVESADKLLAHCGPGRLSIPRLVSQLSKITILQMQKDFETMSANAIALKYGCTDSWVWKSMKKHIDPATIIPVAVAAEASQLGLFDE